MNSMNKRYWIYSRKKSYIDFFSISTLKIVFFLNIFYAIVVKFLNLAFTYPCAQHMIIKKI